MRTDFTIIMGETILKRQIIDTIEQYDTIIIHRHVRPDPDAYGSQIGFERANFSKLSREKGIYSRRA